jgi:hypothetical protein
VPRLRQPAPLHQDAPFSEASLPKLTVLNHANPCPPHRVLPGTVALLARIEIRWRRAAARRRGRDRPPIACIVILSRWSGRLYGGGVGDRLFTLEYYCTADGDQPVRRWIDRDLSAAQRKAVMAALRYLLAAEGVGICASEYGRQLGHGLFELRIRHDEHTITKKAGLATPAQTPRGDVLLRVFCHAMGDRVILLLGGYDKAGDPSLRRQAREIDVARRRLADYRRRHP